MSLKAGLEVHQQLDCGKLFCKCSNLETGNDNTFTRRLHATSSEMGTIDAAAKAEGIRKFTYFNKSCNCLVYTDEEPPRGPNNDAIEIALQFAKLTGSNIIEEIHFMRKVVVDGSNTSGFQRTALVATGGKIKYKDGIIELDQICLEEDSCRHGKNKDEYLLDRLGIPLLEITTKPQLKTPKQVQNAARALGRLLRACRVKRGLGTIRQDVNVSIDGGERVELKGFQDLSTMAKVVENEIERQNNLKSLKGCKVSETIDVTKYISKDRGSALACKLVDWKGKLGTKESPKGHIRMGQELSDYAKKAGVKGLMHSDELPAYGISSEETKELHKQLNCKKNDAFVLIFGKQDMAKDAMNRVIERASINGVPKEVRRVTPEGDTRFLRPMPGASRMYPETDIPPMTLSKIDVEIPKTLDQRETEVPLNEEESRQIVSRNLDAKFYELIGIYDNPKIISRLLLHTLPNLESEKNVIIGKEAITQVLKLAKDDKIAKEGIESALLQASKGKEIELKNENIEAEVREFISNLINEKLDFVKERGMGAIGPLMGPVMSEFRGKMDGSKINELLI
ncbi:MAG: Glu-tRNA(Gln) amidotransferase subunit GatE, partial [Candidatus Poseidoniia archaeon]|nr:Glu-tRNA(Gln) amidotransferase subunit GatE [Candidatus Poseidoniia archaeon]